jgi:hypothetical protein
MPVQEIVKAGGNAAIQARYISKQADVKHL